MNWETSLLTWTNESSFILDDSDNQRHLGELSLHDEFLRLGRNERQMSFLVDARHEGQWKHSVTLQL